MTLTVNQAAGQTDPTSATTVHFTAVFSTAVTGFSAGDVTVGGTAGGTKTVTLTDSGNQKTWDIAVSGITSNGTVTASIAAGKATDTNGTGNNASTSTDNTVTYTASAPPAATPVTLTVNQAAGQTDPTGSTPVHFTAAFSAAVTGFSAGDVTVGGSAGGLKTITVTDSGNQKTYDIAVSGITSDGTITASVAAGSASDIAGTGNNASTSTDNSISYTAPVAPPASGPGSSPWSAANAPIPSNPSVVLNYGQGPLSGLPGIGMSSSGWGVAIFDDQANLPRTTIRTTNGWIADNVPIPSQLDPYLNAMGAIGDAERHMDITDGDRVWNLYGLNKSGSTYTAAAMGVLRINGSGIWDNNMAPWLGRASGFASSFGAVRRAELASGSIDHALAVSWPKDRISTSHVAPAVTSDGNCTSGNCVPMGSRIQLDPSLTDSQLVGMGLSTAYLPVAHALQRYGAYVADSGSWMTIYAETWNNSGQVSWPGGWYPASTNLVSHLRIVGAPSTPVLDNRTTFGQPHQ